jgi:hypothetical protein
MVKHEQMRFPPPTPSQSSSSQTKISSGIGPITENQKDYIKILSSYEYSKQDDEADIANYLKAQNKQNIGQLTKGEASELIQILLNRPTQYTFACGRKAILHKKEVNCFAVLGDLEGCLHACPINANVGGCPEYKPRIDDENEENDEESNPE